MSGEKEIGNSSNNNNENVTCKHVLPCIYCLFSGGDLSACCCSNYLQKRKYEKKKGIYIGVIDTDSVNRADVASWIEVMSGIHVVEDDSISSKVSEIELEEEDVKINENETKNKDKREDEIHTNRADSDASDKDSKSDIKKIKIGGLLKGQKDNRTFVLHSIGSSGDSRTVSPSISYVHTHQIFSPKLSDKSPFPPSQFSLTRTESSPSIAKEQTKAEQIFEWGREELIAQYDARVDILVVDEVGPEAIVGDGLDSALRAIIEKMKDEFENDNNTFVLAFCEKSIAEQFNELYGVASHETRHFADFQEFQDWWMNNGAHVGDNESKSSVADDIKSIDSSDVNDNQSSSSSIVASSKPFSLRAILERSRRKGIMSFTGFAKQLTSKVDQTGEGVVYSILKIPALALILFIVMIEFMAYAFITTIAVPLWESAVRKNKSVYRRMKNTTHFLNWKRVARELDTLEKRPAGGIDNESPIHQFYTRLQHGLKALKEDNARYEMERKSSNLESDSYSSNGMRSPKKQIFVRRGSIIGKTIAPKDEIDLVRTLREVCMNQIYVRIISEPLYTLNHVGSNSEVQAFSELLVECIQAISTCHAMAICPEVMQDGDEEAEFYRKKLLEELRRGFGETVLCLSGGAGNCYFHFGVIKGLFDAGMLPKHLTGASGGALVGSFIATRTDEELKHVLHAEVLCKVFDPAFESWPIVLKRLVTEGSLFDANQWREKLEDKICGKLTFHEAYVKTGRSFTITAFDGTANTRALNYKTTPDLLISTAVLASSAIPKVLPGIELLKKEKDGRIVPDHSMGKIWRDGSFEMELPFDSLISNFNAYWSIVSQVNPHLVPFFFSNRGGAGEVVAHNQGKGWRGGFVLAFLERLIKLDMRKWMEVIRDFELMPRIFNTNLNNLFLGTTYGDCTVYPPLRMWDYYYVISDPNTPERMRRYMIPGLRMIWPKLSMIQDRMRIERSLEQAQR